MPSWKKVIVSGSDASLSSLIVNNGVTGSLQGTASWANNVVSASYASNADLLDGKDSSTFATTGSNTFIGTQIVTGSLFTTGSNTLIGSTTLTGSLNISGSTTQTGNNTLIGNTVLSGSIIISGSSTPGSPTASVQIYGDIRQSGYHRFDPVTTNIDTSITASYIFVSGSTNDLYFSQNNNGYSNVTRLRWLEGNLYTGLLNGGVITAVTGSTTYQISSGSGIIVDLNASLSDDPYPTIQYLRWGNLSASIAPLTASYQQAFVSIDSTGNIYQQGTPYVAGQFDTAINIGVVLFQNGSTINGVKTQPSLAYGFEQGQNIFNRAFGPLKLSGFTLAPSGSSTGSLIVGSGTAYSPGSNYTVDPNNPSYATDSGTSVSKIYRYYQSGSSWVYLTNAGAGFGAIDPTQYSNNGTLTAVPEPVGSRWTIQRVFWFPNSVAKAIVVYYGNNYYGSESEAIANINIESFVEAPNTAANAIYLGAIVINGDGIFTDASDFTIVPGGLFRSVGGSGGGGSIITQTLSGLSDVSISGPTSGQALVYDTTANKWENKSFISASISGNAATATVATTANTASYVLNAVSSSFASTASFVQNAQSASYVLNATSASYASSSTSASYAQNATSASYALNSTSASYALNATSASYALNSTSASYSQNSTSASYALNSTSASYALNSTSASYALNTTSASYALNATSASYASASTSASYALNATSASYALNSTSASYALNATNATNASTASSADNFTVRGTLTAQTIVVQTITSSISVVTGSMTVSGSLNALGGVTGSLLGTASWANNAITASYALTATSASYAATASYTPNINGTTNYVAKFTAGNAVGNSVIYDNGTNVGINTSAPYGGTNVVALDINAPAYPVLALTVNGTYTGGVLGRSNALVLNSKSGIIAFEPSDTERARFDSNGNLGIGTTSPSSQLTLYKGAGVSLLQLINADETGFSLKFHNSGSTSSGAKTFTQFLDYSGNINGYMAFHRGSAGTDGYLSFGDNGGERVRFANGGNVGIGTTSPEAKLHVASGDILISNGQYYSVESTTGGNYKIAGLTSGNVIQIGAIDYTSAGTIFAGGDNISITTGGAAGTSRMYINNGGNVGIGTTNPLSKFQVRTTTNQNFRISAGTNLEVASINDADSAYVPLTFRASNFDFQNGNVGIGTTSPSQKLEVSGSGYIIKATANGADSSYFQAVNGSYSYIAGVATSLGTGYMGMSSNHSLAIVTNGSERMRIDAGGNVGIGTTDPRAKLQIAGGSLDNGTLYDLGLSSALTSGRLGTFDAGSLASISTRGDASSVELAAGTSANYYSGISATANNASLFAGTLRFVTSGSERMRVTADGNVGIGTTSPLKTLQINATAPAIRLQENGSGGDKRLELSVSSSGVATIAANQSAQVLTFETVGSEAMRINASGNVGIGTTSPGQKLDVVQTTNDTIIRSKTTTAGAYFHADSATDGYYGYSLYNGTTEKWFIGGFGSTDLSISLTKGGTQYMTILRSNGNVGIGTTSPSRLLHVAGNIHADGNCFIKGNNNELYFASSSIANASIGTDNSHNIGRADTTGYHVLDSVAGDFVMGAVNGGLTFGTSNSVTYATARMRINNVGNVGIGTTSPSVKLQVVGDGLFNSNTNTNLTINSNGGVAALTLTNGAGSQLIYGGVGGSNVMDFYTNSTFRVRIDANGNVGIGTTSPGSKLHVVGSSAGSRGIIAEFRDSNNAERINIRDENGGTSQPPGVYSPSAGYGLGLYAAAGPLILYAGGITTSEERVRILTTGNVGIGTTSPAYKLDVQGTARFTSRVDIQGAASGLALALPSGQWFGASSTNRMAFDTVDQLFHAGGSGAKYKFRNAGDTDDVLTITNTGNVGIGSASPAYALDVNGTARVTSLIETSTRTLKSNIESYSTDINKFKQLEPVSFTWKDTGKSDVGLIAEEVEQLFPEFVSKTDEGDVTGINYGKLATIFINVLKQQQGKIEELEDKIKKLTS